VQAIERYHFLERVLPVIAAEFDEVVEVELDENVEPYLGLRGDPSILLTFEDGGERYKVRLVAEDGDE
jgi:hypothetical protein